MKLDKVRGKRVNLLKAAAAAAATLLQTELVPTDALHKPWKCAATNCWAVLTAHSSLSGTISPYRNAQKVIPAVSPSKPQTNADAHQGLPLERMPTAYGFFWIDNLLNHKRRKHFLKCVQDHVAASCTDDLISTIKADNATMATQAGMNTETLCPLTQLDSFRFFIYTRFHINKQKQIQ